MNKSIKNILSDFFAYECICCGRSVDKENGIFCKECNHELLFSHTSDDTVISALNYKSAPTKSLILTMKDYKIKALFSYSAKLIANELHKRGFTTINEYYITFAPRNIKSLLKKRFDQSYEIGKCLSIELFGTCKRCIPLFRTSVFSKEQKTLNYNGRHENAGKNLKLIPFAKVPEKLIIIDDVTTTGATLRTLCDLAKRNGAKECILCSVAKQNLE